MSIDNSSAEILLLRKSDFFFPLASDILTKYTTHHGKVSHSKSFASQDSHEKGHLEFFHIKISHEKIETIYFFY